ncbi:Core trichothecene cluster (CTC) protein 14 [Colletotrichum sp. SAR 10_99]|nr:Core trichothecene cluster (CTC) protein 14 [Colletotrichum sp. SAR 10_99]
MAAFFTYLLPLLALPAVQACPTKHQNTTCESVSGNKTVNAFQLYPENADFDEKRCLAYFSVLYNASVATWNPYTSEIKTIELPGLSFDSELHSSGVRVDPLDRLSIIIDAGSAFDTAGQNITGDNILVKYDLTEEKVLWQRNLTEVTGGVYGGFQDTAHGPDGTTYALGTFPSSIIRVSPDGSEATAWYLKTPADHTIHGFSGLVAAPNGKSILIADSSDGQLYRFNLDTASNATAPTPTRVPLTLASTIGSALDGASIPSRYKGTVILVSDNVDGTVVLHSADGKWDSAAVIGTVPNAYLAEGGSTTATVQIGGSVYSVTEWFGDDKVAGTLAGNRTEWPLVDITADIDAFLAAQRSAYTSKAVAIMSLPQEKDVKNVSVVRHSNEESPVRSKDSDHDTTNGANYTESKRTWKSFFWSTLDVPKEEARFLTKLDLTLISSSALGVMCRYLDQVNITNAFNSGMKEDLALYGKELNYANAIWSAAYVFGQIPSNLLLTRVNAPLYIAFLELSWTVFTFATAGVKDVNQLYVFRFFYRPVRSQIAQLGQSGGSMIFWVKSYNVSGKPPVFSVAEINIIPLGINIISIVCTLINSWVSDSLPGSARWPGMVFASVMAIIFPIALAATPVHPPNIGSRWALYYLTALSGTCAGITWTWVNETSRHDPEKRAYTSALMNAFAYIFTAWVPIFTFPANLQPYIVTGNYITAGFGACAALTALLIRHFYNRDLARQKPVGGGV